MMFMGKKVRREDKRGNLTKRDEKMFELICRYHDLDLVADELNEHKKELGFKKDISGGTIRARLYWIREKRKEWQRNINVVNNAQKMCKRLDKLLTSRDLKDG